MSDNIHVTSIVEVRKRYDGKNVWRMKIMDVKDLVITIKQSIVIVS